MKFYLLILSTLLLYSCNQQRSTSDFYMPAEFHPQDAVYVGWFDNPIKDSVIAQIVFALQKSVNIKMIYDDVSIKIYANKFLSGFNIDTNKIFWIKDSLQYDWIRDPGPIFLINNSGEIKIADFNWNSYGYEYVYKDFRLERTDSLFGKIEKREAERLNLEVISSEIVNEGGAMEVNGNGVMMAIKETALQRNPGKTIEEIEKEYLRLTGTQKIIWLNHSPVNDKVFDRPTVDNWFTGGANGHIDEVARFISINTILLAKIDDEERLQNPISKIDYDILEENYQILRQATDIDGSPFEIIRIPSPNLNVPEFYTELVVDDEWRRGGWLNLNSFSDGDTVRITKAVSYLNFFISNDVVLIPKYWKEEMPESEEQKDEEVKNLFLKLFPEKEIIQINPIAINRGGGGIHCVTQQQPTRKS